MSRARKSIVGLLRQHGAVLVRQAKHKIWKLPNGRNYVESSTPSAQNSDLNHLSDLRRALEIPNNGGRAGQRREKPRTQGRTEPIRYEKFNSSLAEQLQLSGAAQSVLQDEIDMQKHHIEVLTERIAFLEHPQCWWCKLRKRVTAHKYRDGRGHRQR